MQGVLRSRLEGVVLEGGRCLTCLKSSPDEQPPAELAELSPTRGGRGEAGAAVLESVEGDFDLP